MTIVSKITRKHYDPVSNNDDYDCRIPLHSADEFEDGISFRAKCIGTLDVPRPTTRLEIVSAMRRIRYEFKARGIKKKKVNITVSTEGVEIARRLKKRKAQKMTREERQQLVTLNPIYRIFYVSHDSQDMKIFSYIARDGSSDVFKCSVFKASKQSTAMRVVRTIGEAFEVCSKLYGEADAASRGSSEALDTSLRRPEPIARLGMPLGDDLSDRPEGLLSSPLADPLGSVATLPEVGAPLSSHHEWQLMKEQFAQQQQQTQAALTQVQLLRDQLHAERTARLEAQSRTHQLVGHNRALLAHVRALMAQLRADDAELELELSSASSASSVSGSCEDVKRAASSDGSSIDAELCRMAEAIDQLALESWAHEDEDEEDEDEEEDEVEGEEEVEGEKEVEGKRPDETGL